MESPGTPTQFGTPKLFLYKHIYVDIHIKMYTNIDVYLYIVYIYKFV